MYLRSMSPSTTCLYSLGSIAPRILSAAFHSAVPFAASVLVKADRRRPDPDVAGRPDSRRRVNTARSIADDPGPRASPPPPRLDQAEGAQLLDGCRVPIRLDARHRPEPAVGEAALRAIGHQQASGCRMLRRLVFAHASTEREAPVPYDGPPDPAQWLGECLPQRPGANGLTGDADAPADLCSGYQFRSHHRQLDIQQAPCTGQMSLGLARAGMGCLLRGHFPPGAGHRR